MVVIFRKKVWSMIRVGIFSFSFGCGIALCFVRIDCSDVTTRSSSPVVRNIEDSAATGVEYAVLVLTSPNNEDNRNAIRSTWGKLVSNIFVENGEKLYKWSHNWKEKRIIDHNLIKVYFVVGTAGLNTVKLHSVMTENSRNKDIILLNELIDKYENLALKVKLSFKWLSENLKGLKYVIKCDDDSFVRVDLIVEELEAFAHHMDFNMINKYVTKKIKTGTAEYKGLYWGYFDGRATVKLKSSKWQEADWFLCDHYLPYALGGGYVVSREIVDFIAKNSDLLSCYRSEDVSMGVWTSPLDGINRVHDIRFDTEWISRGCQNHMLVRHKQKIQDMFEMYKMLVDSKGETLCKTQILHRKPYEYNWSLPPSKCCQLPHPLINGNNITSANVKSKSNKK